MHSLILWPWKEYPSILWLTTSAYISLASSAILLAFRTLAPWPCFCVLALGSLELRLILPMSSTSLVTRSLALAWASLTAWLGGLRCPRRASHVTSSRFIKLPTRA